MYVLKMWDFSRSPVVNNLYFYCRDPWSGNKDPLTMNCGQKRKRKNKKCIFLGLTLRLSGSSSLAIRPKYSILGFPSGSAGNNPPDSAGHSGSIPGWGRSPGEGNDNPLQYSCLGNPMDRGAWLASPWGHKRVGHDLVTKQ